MTNAALDDEVVAVDRLRARGVRKSFGQATVLGGVDLTLRRGRVDGLIGRNGAGKSTLVNVLTGRLAADVLELEIDGEPAHVRGPSDALACGVVAVPQELVMPMDMTVSEVVTFGAEPRRMGVLDLRRALREVRELLDSMGLEIDPATRVSDLPVSWQRVVTVAQALYRRARVLILDEPTAAMNAEDCARVLEVVRRVRDRGLAVLYISHRFDEVEQLCDRVTVMADGLVVDVLEGAAVTHDRLVRAITGSETTAKRVRRAPKMGTGVGAELCASELSGHSVASVDLTVRPGELVGLAGLPGSGVEEIFQLLAGRARPDAGTVTIGNDNITSAGRAARLGVALLPASRADASLPGERVLENLSLPALRRLSGPFGFVTVSWLRHGVADVSRRLSLAPVAERRMGELSGGNQQRVLVGAKLLAAPRYLLLEDPTVGVDVAARAELHQLLWSLADEGMGLVVGSSDGEELIDLCDRVVAVRRGRTVAEWDAGDVTEQELMTAITGSGAGIGALAGPQERNQR
ncbi:MAG: sugar ABC transporter ATP-binding protein [Microbacterium gubbeenense]